MSVLMLLIDDAVQVAKQFCDDDEEILRQEFEQKCWIAKKQDSDARERLIGLIMDIHPKEIASQIENDNLKNWCQNIQVSMQMALITIEEVDVVRCKDCKFYPGGYFSDDRIMIETYMHCPNFKDDGFCSFGRRKEE